MSDHSRTIITTGIIGIIGTIVVGIGEFLLHYSSGGYDHASEFLFFQYVSENRLFYGHFIATLGVPIYFVGYYHLYLMLKPGSKTLALTVMIMGIYAFAIADVWIGSRGILGLMIHKNHSTQQLVSEDIGQYVSHYNTYMESLLQILRVLVALISLVYIFLVLKGRTLYPKWAALFNPIVLLISVFLVFMFLPAIGNYIAPIAMNVAHLIFFSLSLYLFLQKQPIKINE